MYRYSLTTLLHPILLSTSYYYYILSNRLKSEIQGVYSWRFKRRARYSLVTILAVPNLGHQQVKLYLIELLVSYEYLDIYF